MEAAGVRHPVSDYRAYPRKRRNTSKVWQFFNIVGEEAICSLCNASFTYHETSGTSTLLMHLRRKHATHIQDGGIKKEPHRTPTSLLHSELQKPATGPPTPWSLLQQAQPAYCVDCQTKFPDKKSLEDHECPGVKFICTCGSGFTNYQDMLLHRNGHYDTSSFQTGHMAIFKQRTKDTELHEKKLQMMKSIDKQLTASPAPPAAAQQQPQCRELVPARSGATVNLRAYFQPAVQIATKMKFSRGNKYMCGTCRVVFWEKKLLLEHIATHLPTHIYGCQQCGLLLISGSPPSPTHSCGTYQASRRERFTKGHIIGNVLQPKPSGLTRCPYCPTTFFKPWFIARHIKKAHAGKPVPRVPVSKKFENPVYGFVANPAPSAAPGFPMSSQSAMPGFAVLPAMPGYAVPSAMSGFAVPPAMSGFAVPSAMSEFAVPPSMSGFAMPSAMSGFAVPSAMPGLAVPPAMPGFAMLPSIPGLAMPYDSMINKPAGYEMITHNAAPPDESSLPPTKEEQQKASKIAAILEMIAQAREREREHEREREAQERAAEKRREEEAQQHRAEAEITAATSTLKDECRCAVCGKTMNTIQMLVKHWCSRELPLLTRDKLPSSVFKYTNGYKHSFNRPAPYPVPERPDKDSGGVVTVRLQTSHNADMHEPTLQNEKVEPSTALSCPSSSKSIAVQTKVEFDDGNYGTSLST
ncbi:uncharacterized protein LOC134448426 [Engraulis encrasicolus]|uniref:uncharacterized protein LOC134448426 n=1 Tax=Engraulis encrasicolus TaxID=184585 RepID=UPI002FD5A82F